MLNIRVVDYLDAIPSWAPAGATKLPLEVVKELYPEYVLWGPEPQKFLDVVKVIGKVVSAGVNCEQFLRVCKETQIYSVEARLIELQSLDGDIAYRADYMIEKIIGNNFSARVRVGGHGRSNDMNVNLIRLFTQLQTNALVDVKTDSIIRALYASVVDEELGSWLYPSHIRAQVATAYEALKLTTEYPGAPDVV